MSVALGNRGDTEIAYRVVDEARDRDRPRLRLRPPSRGSISRIPVEIVQPPHRPVVPYNGQANVAGGVKNVCLPARFGLTRVRITARCPILLRPGDILLHHRIEYVLVDVGMSGGPPDRKSTRLNSSHG